MTDDELIPCPLCGNISVVIESDGDLLYWGACHNNECDDLGGLSIVIAKRYQADLMRYAEVNDGN